MANKDTRSKKIIQTSIIGILGNVFLVAAKMIIGLLASSISIVLDAVNNLTDALSSTVTIIGTKLANKRPNRCHPFGFGRIEYVTSSIIGMLIFVAGALAIYESITSLIHHDEPTYDIYSFIIIGLAILVKVVLGLFFRKRGKDIPSDAVRASGIDALLDSVLSLGTLVGALVSYFTGVHLEGYIGIAIGLFIIKTSIDVFRESISKIIGERADAKFTQQMLHDIGHMDGVYGVYDLILNNYGPDRFIGSVHIEVKETMTAKELQRLERDIATMCFLKYKTIMTAGVYARIESESAIKAREQVQAIVRKHPEVLQLHGFYYDEIDHRINFDIIIDINCKNPDQIYAEIFAETKQTFPNDEIVIVLDTDFSLTGE